MKISLLTLVCASRTLEETISMAAANGYDGIELWGNPAHLGPDTTLSRAKEIGACARDNGLSIPAVASYVGGFSEKSDDECQKELVKLEKYLILMNELDCNTIRVNCGGPSIINARRYHLEKALYWMEKSALLAKQYGKNVTMEIHNGNLIETLEAADDFVRTVNLDNLGLIHDAGNMYITDTEYGEKSVGVLNKWIFHVHVKDELRINDDNLPGAFHSTTIYGDEIFAQKQLGEGAVDHVPLFKGLIKADYKGFLSSECHAPVADAERVSGEIRIIRELLAQARNELDQARSGIEPSGSKAG